MGCGLPDAAISASTGHAGADTTSGTVAMFKPSCRWSTGSGRRSSSSSNSLQTCGCAQPLNDGHCLIIPRRHEADFLAITADELAAIWALVPAVRRHVEQSGVPDGYNIGINVGEAAGHTVAHAH